MSTKVYAVARCQITVEFSSMANGRWLVERWVAYEMGKS